MESISLKNGFHGITGYGMSISTNNLKISDYPKLYWPKFDFPCSDCYKDGKCSTGYTSNEKSFLESIETYISSKGKEYIASIIIELVQGGGGDNHLCADYVHGLKEICEKNDILFIIDEVQTGFGVSGKLWCYEHYKVEPHLLTFGKKAQISGVCIGKNIPDVDKVINVPGRLSPTWNGDITDYIRCKYIIKAYKEYDLIDNAAELGNYIVSSLKNMNVFRNVRGRGFLIAFDFKNTDERDRYDQLCFEEGLFLLPMRDVALRMRPNMALTKDEADHALSIMSKINNYF